MIDYKIVKKSIDSRNKNDILFIYSVNVNLINNEEYFKNIEKFSNPLKYNIKKHKIRLVDDYEYKIEK